MALRSSYLYAILKVGTVGLLGALLFFLGSAARQASPTAYISFFGILLLQAVEVFYPPSEEAKHPASRLITFRASILLQLILASLLVAATGGSGSIYELMYLLPIVSAASNLPGREVALVVGGAVTAMIGFIVTGEQLSTSSLRVKDFQDAVAAIVYFTMAGIFIYMHSKTERDQCAHYQAMTSSLEDTNAELRRVQAELTERLDQLTQMEERIHQISQKAALGELAAQVAHEIRNPLGIIKGATEMLASRVDDPAIQRPVTVLLEEVDRLDKAVENVLRLGAPLRIRKEPFNIQELLKSVKQIATGWSQSGSWTLQLDAFAAPLKVQGDWELLHHALINLVRNAFQAMPQGGTVTVSAQPVPGNGKIVISIADTGIGLSADDVKRLGEPFFTRRAGGVGLGVALARRIINEHGGMLEAQSTVGRGTTLTILLPSEPFHSGGNSSLGSVKVGG